MPVEDSQLLPVCYLSAPLPPNETQRLRALQGYGILDSNAEAAFDELTQMAAMLCDMPIALMSLLDHDRQWFKARIGVDDPGTPREISFCSHAILVPDDVMVVPDARLDPRFAGNPLVTGDAGIVFYAGAPIVSPTGEAIGSLCVADRRPRKLNLRQLQLLRGLANQAMVQLELRRSLTNLEAVMESQSRYVSKLEQHQQKLERSQARLVHENATDPLTNVGNRRAFQLRLGAELARAGRNNAQVGLMLIDVDCFKRYNDSFGHPAGDDVLTRLAAVLQRTCRGYDFAARIGGEEFAVILPSTGRESAFAVAERLRRSVQGEVWPHRPVTVSIGVALSRGEADSALDVQKRADAALYRSKADGRNRVTVDELPVG